MSLEAPDVVKVMAYNKVVSFFILGSLVTFGVCLQVDCGYETARNMISCRCIGPQRSTLDGYEYISEILDENIRNQFVGLNFYHVELRDCSRLELYINLG